jgi:ADP-heptose:LPS heptosyltransferase
VEATANCAINLAGCLNLEEFAVFLQAALVVITVNTGAAHLCAAVQTPLVVLHAQTNPQHSPWMVSHKILPFSLKENQQSKNQVIQFVNEKLYRQHISYPVPAKV